MYRFKYIFKYHFYFYLVLLSFFTYGINFGLILIICDEYY